MRIHHLDRRQVLLGAAALAGCASGTTTTPQANAEADASFRDLVDRLAERSRPSRIFTLRRFDAEALTPEGRILYEAVLRGAEADAALAGRAWGRNGLPYAVTHRYGAYRQAVQIGADEDPRRLARLVNRETNQLEGDAARRVVPPDFLIDATLPAVETAATQISGRTDEEYEALAGALERQVSVLRALRGDAPTEAGVWRLPDGEAFYAQALQFALGAEVDPREAHARALARARELQSESDALLRAQGLREGSVAERLRALARDPRQHYATGDAGKAAAVADMNAQLARVRGVVASAIDGAGEARGEVRVLPAQLEAAGAQGRRQGSIYFVDLGAPRPRWTLPSVVCHELIPGHILQAPYERAASAAQLQLRYSGGYSEGWSTYAEQLADELGAFADDPVARIGYLQWMLFRMARVVGDTGIHVMRWSRERAIEEMRALQGESTAFVSIENDVTRFFAQPGQFAAQGLAALHIAELRERTRRSVGGAFNLARFHVAMLRHGPLSPPGLDQAARAAFSA